MRNDSLSTMLSIDAKRYAAVIAAFIAAKVKELARDGIVVPISGGLDSSVVAALSVRAVGNKRVTGLLLPEKQGNPDADRYAKILAVFLGIKTRTIDITRPLAAFGSYDFILARIPGRNTKERVVRFFSKKENFVLAFNKGTKNKLVRSGIASYYLKQRVRLLAVYKFAEERNLLVCGSAHKSEDMVGLYVKFGVDDAADVMPLKHLYRAQIVSLAEYCNIPREIVGRPPNPDLVPGVTDKYSDILRIDSKTVDLILWGMECGLSSKKISRELGLEEKKVAEIEELVRATLHMRNPSMAPTFESVEKGTRRKARNRDVP